MNSHLRTRVQNWCLAPTEFWDYETTRLLVQNEWAALHKRDNWNSDNYSTAGYYLNDPQFVSPKIPILEWANEKQIYLESPYPNELEGFFTENDLSPVNQEGIHSIGVVKKLDDAMILLNAVPNLAGYIAQLVRRIVVLKSANPEEDVSYSHPALPFSIFVSVCEERSIEASARVAESILHEAMHLRLSLIQKVVNILEPGRQEGESYFAPWRHVERPVNGVLHGIFVFRAILEFFRKLAFISKDKRVKEYSSRRIQQISFELEQVADFYKSPALSDTGFELARQLLNI